jgi:Na+/H+ antiporter NhaD/arsenite permease-like protein
VDYSLLVKMDYSLLITFFFLFIFIGNLGQIKIVRTLLEAFIIGREMEIGILSSQFISNVPAAMLLSGFTKNYKALLWGVNIGGLGTMIASMASLISYKYYVNTLGSKKRKYFKVFTIYNLIFLLLLWGFAFIIQ